MTKPRRVSVMSTVLKETQEYNKVTQEDEQVIPVEQKTVNTEKQISVDTDKHMAVTAEVQKSVSTDIQTPVTTEVQKSVSIDMQKSVKTAMQKPASTEATHKQTILISEDLAFRLKVHAARRKETIANIATRAFERLLAEEDI
jgi:hypothetical protein